MTYALVLAKSGRALVIGTEKPELLAHVILGLYATREEAEGRCEVENYPEKRKLFLAGKLQFKSPSQ